MWTKLLKYPVKITIYLLMISVGLFVLFGLIDGEIIISIFFAIIGFGLYKLLKKINAIIKTHSQTQKVDYSTPQKAQHKNPLTKEKMQIETVPQNKPKKSDNKLTYNEEDIILPEYADLETPDFIKNEIERLSKDKQGDNHSQDNEIRVTVRIEGLGDEKFVKDSLKYKSTPGFETEFVPLYKYWTTFESLDENQKQWYFYWREQVVKGNFLDTDLSYIILFTYELINYTFNLNAAFNVSMMVQLYEAYKDRVPKINNYLPTWIHDMLIELDEKELAQSWGTYTRRSRNPYEKFYKTFKKHKDDISKISMNQWNSIIQRYNETKFFKNNKKKVYTTFKKALKLFQEENKEEGQDLEEAWFEEKVWQEKRYLFNSAVVRRRVYQYDVEYKEMVPTQYLFNEITALFRLSENVARKLSGEKRQIKVEEQVLPEGFKNRLLDHLSKEDINKVKEEENEVPSRFKHAKKEKEKSENYGSEIPKNNEHSTELHKSTNREKIQLDENEAKEIKLNHESFINQFQENVEDEVDAIEESTEDKEGKNKKDIFEEPEIFEEDLDLKKFISELTENERLLLKRLFEDGQLIIEEVNNFLRDIGVTTGVFISKLNEKSDEILGDVILEQRGEHFIINEDFEELVETLKEEEE
ncbi:TerB N-terminal domain-containing protein [Natranaerobius thermophilus]|uniref:TerB-C domain-containing protein n=1 Tax=Natranaerobius thermophilus (strain ATCC BAA-1301 / DSM 18059 / JW/NM-WN-LF) TaxID=457570 RepID=B2A403_NATTJ|nr:TerB N-terminal domain-containing protein [Natranaerobius thermophilus]ACB85105.1 hypothetical protein Nther_1525 [Natranaerobius thermophilus JW/NM-WN-LF]